jgi:hypothetical protein
VARGTVVDHRAAVRRRLVVEDRMNRPVVERRMGCIHPVGLRILPVGRTDAAGGLRMLADRSGLLAVGLAEERMLAYRRVTADHSLCVVDLGGLGKNVAGCVDLVRKGYMTELMSSLGRTVSAVGKRPGAPRHCRSRWSHDWSNHSSVLADRGDRRTCWRRHP